MDGHINLDLEQTLVLRTKILKVLTKKNQVIKLFKLDKFSGPLIPTIIINGNFLIVCLFVSNNLQNDFNQSGNFFNGISFTWTLFGCFVKPFPRQLLICPNFGNPRFLTHKNPRISRNWDLFYIINCTEQIQWYRHDTSRPSQPKLSRIQ